MVVYDRNVDKLLRNRILAFYSDGLDEFTKIAD